MSATLRIVASIQTINTAIAGATSADIAQDAAASTHDYVDPAPLTLATAGGVGAAFSALGTNVVRVERFAADFRPATDAVIRFGGLVATVASTLTPPPTFAGGEALTLGYDGVAPVSVAFLAGDSASWALVAKRINFVLGASVASVDPVTATLRLSGLRTGGADALAKLYSYGALVIGAGTALALLGLVAGTTYGVGDDQRVGAGPFCKSFPATALPTRVELSGTTTNARFWVAGKST